MNVIDVILDEELITFHHKVVNFLLRSSCDISPESWSANVLTILVFSTIVMKIFFQQKVRKKLNFWVEDYVPRLQKSCIYWKYVEQIYFYTNIYHLMPFFIESFLFFCVLPTTPGALTFSRNQRNSINKGFGARKSMESALYEYLKLNTYNKL